MKTIRQHRTWAGQIAIVRVDFNVPLRRRFHKMIVEDDTKLRLVIPTIKYLLQKKARVLLISHLGRPLESKIGLSLKPVAQRLSDLLHQQVLFVESGNPFCIKCFTMNGSWSLAMMENIRFFEEEEENDLDFAAFLASLGDVYVNDAFAASHRAHASVVGITKYLPSYAGLLLQKEIKACETVMAVKKHPLVLVMGGAKAETKIPLIKYFLHKADFVLLGGVLANTLLKAKGVPVADSLVDSLPKTQLSDLLQRKKIQLPVDYVWSTKGKKKMIVDIGPKTIALYKKVMKNAQCIVWNGPMGWFEHAPYNHGTQEIAKAFVRATEHAYTLAGGGETVDVLKHVSGVGRVDHISSGGGALLEYISGKSLPGIEALQ